MTSVAFVGRQNAGKTSLFMHLTGSVQRPINFPGSSVERTEGVVRGEEPPLRVVDLPGISSFEALSRDEEVALSFLTAADSGIDVLCAVVDASKLSVELRFLGQLFRLGQPVVVALNKGDVARSAGRPVDPARLGAELGVRVVETDGLRARGLEALVAALRAAGGAGRPEPLNAEPEVLAARVHDSSEPAKPKRTMSDRLDAVLLHRVLGLPILGLLMLGIFQLVYSGAEPFIGAIEAGQEWLADQVRVLLPPGALRSFAIDGLINGVGSVVVFLPQIALLMALVAVLEASGYMARAAFLLDRILRGFGLSGRSFVPLTSSFACAIPGILASRIITDERDRLATIAVAPLMSCSARLPVYVVLIGAFFPAAWAGLVLLGLYGLGIVVAAVVAWVLRRTVLRGGPSLLMMELPAYQRPALKAVWGQVWTGVREFVALAGTIILGTSVVIWALSYYPRPSDVHERYEAQRNLVEELPEAERAPRLAELAAAEDAAYLEGSYLATAGKAIQPLFAPAGFEWRTTVGVLAAFPARELIVPTLGILHSVGEVDAGDYDLAELGAPTARPNGLRQRLRRARREDGSPAFDSLVALALMIFFALCSQCMATLGAIRRETHSMRWPVFTFVYMTTLAWLAAVGVFQVGRALGLGS